jgi:general secretion pathway protein G
MKTTLRQYAAKGFTLIELLIVVIIIAILAAIAIPQFGNSTNEAADAALDANLNTVRSAIELYRVQHNNNFPAQVAPTAPAAGVCTGVSSTAGVTTQAAFVAQLTNYSNRAGQTCSVPAIGFDYGPYLRAIPRDPASAADVAAATNVAVTAASFAGAPPDATLPGWRFNTADGRFEMNSVALDRNNTPYWRH